MVGEFFGPSFGEFEELSASYTHRRQHGPILWISLYHCRRMASTEGERWQWLMDGLHRLVPRKRSRSASPAASGARSISRPQGIRGDGRGMHPRVWRHFITKGSRSGGSYTRSAVLPRGPGRPRGRIADIAQLKGNSPALLGDDHCGRSHDTRRQAKQHRSQRRIVDSNGKDGSGRN